MGRDADDAAGGFVPAVAVTEAEAAMTPDGVGASAVAAEAISWSLACMVAGMPTLWDDIVDVVCEGQSAGCFTVFVG